MPTSVSQGVELETTWTPIDHLSILFNYSYLDSTISKGQAADPADPNALEPGAKPMPQPGEVRGERGDHYPMARCSADVYSKNGSPLGIADPYAGFNVPQNLAGNPLPNAPRNKIAINVLYDYKTDNGVKIAAVGQLRLARQAVGRSSSRIPTWVAPSWDEWDARVSVCLAERPVRGDLLHQEHRQHDRLRPGRASPPARRAPWTSRTAPAASRRSTTCRA